MSQAANAQADSNSDDSRSFTGLEGVEALVSSPALEILRELGHGAEFSALMQLARIVEEQESQLEAAA